MTDRSRTTARDHPLLVHAGLACGRRRDVDPRAARRGRVRPGRRGHRPPGLARLPGDLGGRRAGLPDRGRPPRPPARRARRLHRPVPASRAADDRRRGVRGPPPAARGGRAARLRPRAGHARDGPGCSCGRAADECERLGRRPDLRGAGGDPARRTGRRGGAVAAGGDRQPVPRPHARLQPDHARTPGRVRHGAAPPRPPRRRRHGRPPDLGTGRPRRPAHRRGARLGRRTSRARPRSRRLVAGVFGRTGRQQPADWAHLLPLVHHAHAKFWDPDVESVREPHGAWIAALQAADYAGAVVSEWGGHELLDRADADALAVTRAHHDLLAELSADRDGGDRHDDGRGHGAPGRAVRPRRTAGGGGPPAVVPVPADLLPGVGRAWSSTESRPRCTRSGSAASPAASRRRRAPTATWDLRDALDVVIDAAGQTGDRHAVEVAVAVRIPYIQLAPGVALVQRAVVRTEGTVR